ncbi:MAG: DnaB-like helicase C-terminal domain-containing protein [Thermoguttaceae bacterium]
MQELLPTRWVCENVKCSSAIPILTADEVETFLSAARALNEKVAKPTSTTQRKPKPKHQPQTVSVTSNGDSPADNFNTRGRETFKKCLEKHGWQYEYTSGDNEHWRRPEKDGDGTSATLHLTEPLFYVFSTNAFPFEANRAYNFFQAYAILEHGDNLSAATKALIADGYGSNGSTQIKLPDGVAGEPASANGAKAADITSSVISGTDALDALWHSIQHGEPPKRWHSDPDPKSAINGFAMRPGVVIVIGGAPGAGKTAFLMETVYKAMKIDKEVTALFVNVEMTSSQLLERLLASQASVPLGDIIELDLTPEKTSRLEAEIEKIHEAVSRFSFAKPPYTIEAIKEMVKSLDPKIVILDYTQRLRIEKSHAGQSARDKINIIMEDSRSFANEGRCVIAVSALSRGDNGHNKSITSFRDSSEFEYGADDIWILDKFNENEKGTVLGTDSNRVLRCLKNAAGSREIYNSRLTGNFSDLRRNTVWF